jgi:hypothetical protein
MPTGLYASSLSLTWNTMTKPTPHRAPDPMAGVVDRLLAQLPGLQGHPEDARAPAFRSASSTVVVGTASRNGTPSEPTVLGMWFRVLLALSLAVTMGWWPYSRECGLPLFGYLGAVLIVLVSGTWAAAASWGNRSALAHVISLTLIFYAIMLTGSELLPRTGYAVRQASWTCDDLGPTPSMVLSQGTMPENQ